jgi:hypothetical protein
MFSVYSENEQRRCVLEVKPINVPQLTQGEWLRLGLLVCQALQGRFSSIFEFCRATVAIRKLFFSCQSLITARSAA